MIYNSNLGKGCFYDRFASNMLTDRYTKRGRLFPDIVCAKILYRQLWRQFVFVVLRAVNSEATESKYSCQQLGKKKMVNFVKIKPHCGAHVSNTVTFLISGQSRDPTSTVTPYGSFALWNRIEWHSPVESESRDGPDLRDSTVSSVFTWRILRGKVTVEKQPVRCNTNRFELRLILNYIQEKIS